MRGRIGWLRRLGPAESGGRVGPGDRVSMLLILMTLGALLAQAFSLYFELNRRTIRNTAGIALNVDLVVTPDDEAAQRIGIQDGDLIVAMNGQPVVKLLEYRQVLNRLAVGSPLTLTVLRDGRTIELPPVAVERMPLDVAVPLRQLAGLAFLLVGGVVVVLGPKERVTRLFALASLLLGMYVGLMHVRTTGLIYLQAAALAFAPAAIIHFFLSFPQEWAPARSKWLWLLYVPSLVLTVLIIVAYYDALQNGTGYFFAPLYALLTDKVGFAYLGLSGVLGLAMMGHAYATASQPVRRRQLQWILLGLSFSVGTAVVDLFLTLSKLHNPMTSRWLLLGFLPIPIAFAFAILHYRLWDLDLVINRSAVYSLVTAALVALYLLLVGGLSTLLGIAAGGRGYAAVLFLSALLIGLLFNPLRTRIQSAIDRVFFRQQVDHQAALARWSEELSTSLRFSDLARLLLEEVPQRLQVDRAWLLVLDEGEDCLVQLTPDVEGSGGGQKQSPPGPVPDLVIPVRRALALGLSRPGTVLLLQEVREHAAWGRGARGPRLHSPAGESQPVAPGTGGPCAGPGGEEGRDAVEGWKQAGVGLALPLISGGQGVPLGPQGARPVEGTGLVGIYLLGHKLSGDVYQRQEMELLRTLSNQAAIAIANARLYERVTGFSQELELKVQDRTKELRDFVSAVYHELSTPITSIRGFTDVLLEREGEQLNARQRRYLVTVRRNVGRLMRLVMDLSDISKLEDGRLTIHPEPIDLRRVMSETVGSLAGIVDEKGLQVTVSISPDIATVEGDRDRVMQILSNLLTNACRYTPAGGQIIVAADVQVGDGGTRLAKVTVSDTGIGIHKDDLGRIFERFYRSEDPLVQDQPGTGLGLSITRSLVELHGSQLWVDSTVGQGSTFGFSLPVVEGIPLFADVEGRIEVGAESGGPRSDLIVGRG